MKIEQIYTGCLAQGAYYIESDGEAAIVDPLREVQPYLDRAEKANSKIKYVLETHFHADFVSGHLDLAKKTGARIVYGPNASAQFRFYGAKDQEELRLGRSKIRVIHTPGHTMESTCYLLIDEDGNEVALFSGDTLFIGDVGRPDLAQKLNADLTQEKLAGHLFDSLRNKIMVLRDEIIVYPAHGAGSACGKNMSSETTDTLGHQKKTNYALRADMTKEEFIREVTSGLVKPPAYFPKNVLMNKGGYESIDNVLYRGLRPLSPQELETLANETGALILDVRDPQNFVKGFIPKSINIGLRGSFAPWVGTLIPDINQEIILVTEPGDEKEAVIRLSRVGFDHVIGYLQGGFESWQKTRNEIDNIQRISAQQLASAFKKDSKMLVLDVRKKSEYESESLIGSENLPLDFINDYMNHFDRDKQYYVYCGTGYRSVIFISILKARGFENLIDVTGGFKAIKEIGELPLTAYKCPTTML